MNADTRGKLVYIMSSTVTTQHGFFPYALIIGSPALDALRIRNRCLLAIA
jgi:hypothetical protein